MKYYCAKCQLLSKSSNVWCQRHPCAANNAAPTLGFGDYVEDIRINRLLFFLDSAILPSVSEASRMFCLRLLTQTPNTYWNGKRKTLFEIQTRYSGRRFRWLHRPPPYPYLPILLSAQTSQPLSLTTLTGKTTFGEAVVTYSVLHYDPALYESIQLLETLLLENAQPWYQNAIWLVTALADVLTLLHRKMGSAYVIGNLSPRHILVRRDKRDIMRPIFD